MELKPHNWFAILKGNIQLYRYELITGQTGELWTYSITSTGQTIYRQIR